MGCDTIKYRPLLLYLSLKEQHIQHVVGREAGFVFVSFFVKEAKSLCVGRGFP